MYASLSILSVCTIKLQVIINHNRCTSIAETTTPEQIQNYDGSEGSQFSFIFHSPVLFFHSPVLFFRSPVLLFHSPVLFFHSPVLFFHSPVLFFSQSSFIFSQSSFLFFSQSSFIFTQSSFNILFNYQLLSCTANQII